MTDLHQEVTPAAQTLDLTGLEDILRQEDQVRLRQAIHGLPEKMRACLAMRVYQELSYQEIAGAMRLSIETVKAHLYQARQRLKKELADRPRPENKLENLVKEAR